jgi:hypothetical protein
MWVCGRSLAEIVGSNTGGVMDVCCECWVLSPSVVCPVSVIAKRRGRGKRKERKKKKQQERITRQSRTKVCGSVQIVDFHHGVHEHSGSVWIRN